MPLFRCGFLLVLVSSLTVVCRGQETNFPTDDEIKLLLTQTERALVQYKPLLDREESLFGEKGKEVVAKDQELVQGLETAIKAFRKNPQGFNSKLGFSFFEWIDDADRNTLLCASSASSEAVNLMLDGKTAKARSLAELSQSPQWSGQKRPTVVRSKPANGCGPGLKMFYPVVRILGKPNRST